MFNGIQTLDIDRLWWSNGSTECDRLQNLCFGKIRLWPKRQRLPETGRLTKQWKICSIWQTLSTYHLGGVCLNEVKNFSSVNKYVKKKLTHSATLSLEILLSDIANCQFDDTNSATTLSILFINNSEPLCVWYEFKHAHNFVSIILLFVVWIRYSGAIGARRTGTFLQRALPPSTPFPCNTSGQRSQFVPDSVHQLRPGKH